MDFRDEFQTPSARLNPSTVTDGVLALLGMKVTDMFELAATTERMWDQKWFDWAGTVLVEEIRRSEGG